MSPRASGVIPFTKAMTSDPTIDASSFAASHVVGAFARLKFTGGGSGSASDLTKSRARDACGWAIRMPPEICDRLGRNRHAAVRWARIISAQSELGVGRTTTSDEVAGDSEQ